MAGDAAFDARAAISAAIAQNARAEYALTSASRERHFMSDHHSLN